MDEAAYITYEQFEQQQLEAQQLKDILDEADEAVRILAANGQAHLNGGYCQGVIKRILKIMAFYCNLYRGSIDIDICFEFIDVSHPGSNGGRFTAFVFRRARGAFWGY